MRELFWLYLDSLKSYAYGNVNWLVSKQRRNVRQTSARAARFESRFGINIGDSFAKWQG